MFKNKNRVARISNAILFIFLILPAISLLGLLTNTGEIPKADLYSNMILMVIYIVCSSTALFITNKKMDLYKDEYCISRQVFNLFILLSVMSLVLLTGMNILSFIYYKNVSLYPVILEVMFFAIVYALAYKAVSKDKLLSKNNEKKINVGNFVIIILLINYSSVIISTILQIIFKMVDIVPAIKDICISFIWIAVVLIAYKLINEKHK